MSALAHLSFAGPAREGGKIVFARIFILNSGGNFSPIIFSQNFIGMCEYACL